MLEIREKPSLDTLVDRSESEQHPDFRRRGVRDRAASIVHYAEFLPPQDRQLLVSVFADGLSMQDVARLMGQSDRRVRTRVHQLVKRVTDPLYLFVVSHRGEWSPRMRGIATECFVHGRSIREAAQALGFTYHTTRKARDAVAALAAAVVARGPARRAPGAAEAA